MDAYLYLPKASFYMIMYENQAHELSLCDPNNMSMYAETLP